MAEPKSELVAKALFALVGGITWSVATAPTVTRNEPEPNQIPDRGWVNVEDGEIGEPIDVLLSPRLFTYAHELLVRVTVQKVTAADRDALAAALAGDIGAAIAAEAAGGLLGGLVDDLEVPTVDVDSEPAEGAASIKTILIPVVATYDTPSPLA